MRLFTQISFLTTLLALFSGMVVALIAVAALGAPRILFILVIPVGCLAYFLSLIIARFVSAPLRELVLAARAYQHGDKSVKFSGNGSMHEVDELASYLDEFTRIHDARIEELVSLKKRQDEFISDVAHEFRTPLTAISGNAELMMDPDMPQATRERFCEIIYFEADRLKKLTNNLLAHQHAQEGVPAAALKRLNIEPVARDVVDILEPIAQDKKVELSVEGAAPDVLGNEDRLKQALINLVDNAIRHVSEGGHVRVVLSGLNGQTVVAVKDDGVGFGDVDPQMLFKRFYRTDFSRARNSGGAGLGLAIVKEIVESHDGTVSAFNSPEGGATFVMAFPSVK